MDRRLTPANTRVAHVSLRGEVRAGRFVEGTPARIALPVVDLLRDPGGAQERQLLLGARVLVLERAEGHAFVQAERDGYVGYVAEAALGPDAEVTHRVAVPATHLYPAADLKRREVARLSCLSELRITGTSGQFSETAEGLFVPTVHLQPLAERAADPVAVAEGFLGTPYLWGGNSRDGIDCSGLVQVSLWACGLPCPGDSDLQAGSVGRALAEGEGLQRGDLLFWRGHVAMVVDGTRLIHANGHAMAVSYEGIEDAIARILAAGEGPVTARRRPVG